ncbi:MAG: chemotaxis protein CheA, partial [Gammaproteobacteria bacterium]
TFVNRVGEMVMLRNMLSHALHDDEMTMRLRRLRLALGNATPQATALGSQDANALRELLGDIEARLEHLAQADLRLQGALGRLQEDVLGLRVVPIGMVFNRLPRVVRDLSHAQNKNVELEISGEDVRIDKGMVEVLLEPLMHMVRNSIDHGVESPAERAKAGKRPTATLSLTARQQGNSLLVEVADDGRGLNRERIRARAIAAGLLPEAEANALSDRELCNLVFLPGFSTAERVTEVSGRGVGMDVVKTRIMQLGGQIDVQSPPGQGARFTLRLPLSVAIQNVILVAVDDRQFALPERNVTEVISIAPSQLQRVQGQAACLLRGVTLPVYHLGMLTGGASVAASDRAELEIIVLSDGVFRIGILVDRVIGRPEVFVRDMHPDIARLPGVGGVSILGDGRVVVILDCENLFELATRNAQSLRSLLRAS